jgi:hypothetical protein
MALPRSAGGRSPSLILAAMIFAVAMLYAAADGRNISAADSPRSVAKRAGLVQEVPDPATRAALLWTAARSGLQPGGHHRPFASGAVEEVPGRGT